EFEAVVLRRIMAAGDCHAGSAAVQVRRKVDQRRVDEPQVHGIEAARLQARLQRIRERRTADPAVMSHHHAADAFLARLRGQRQPKAIGKALIQLGGDGSANVVGLEDGGGQGSLIGQGSLQSWVSLSPITIGDRFVDRMQKALTMETLEALRAMLGAPHVLTGADAQPFMVDWRERYRGQALAVVRPADTGQVAQAVRFCADHDIPLIPQGGNTGLCGGATPDASGSAIILSLQRLNRIRGIDTDNDTMEVEAG